MGAISRLFDFFASQFADWRSVDLSRLVLWQNGVAWLAAIVCIAVPVTMAVFRSGWARGNRKDQVALPALPPLARPSRSFVRHAPALLLLGGLPFFLLALADPHTVLTETRTTFPGLRICLMIDASASMNRFFDSPELSKQARDSEGHWTEGVFFTAVAAAERFVRLRTDGQYRDLMALVEFGDQAYVVTPFTGDYQNIRLSLSLIGDLGELDRFPDQGTIISTAIEQGVRLFRTFDFLDAAGNIMVLFTDGEDSGVIRKGRSVDQIVAQAVAAKIPVYLIRVNYKQALGEVVPDATWKTAVERTGGRFYAAANEETVLRAIRDIDRAAVGRIDVKRYASPRVRFEPFAFVAAALWTAGGILKLTVPYFRRFP